MKLESLDLIDRDPNGINEHVKISFEDIIAEPDGSHSLNCIWSASYACFVCWKSCTYNCLTLFYGICIAAEWGYGFAIVAFYHIWLITPCFRMLELNCAVLKKLYGLAVHCFLDPCCEACGNIFHPFKRN